jgi:hypothetical protein
VQIIPKIIALFSAMLILSGCAVPGEGIESAAVSPEPQENINARQFIESQVLAYTDYECTPKYAIRAGIKEMNVFDGDKFFSTYNDPDTLDSMYYLIDHRADSVYGNLAIRATYLSSTYHNSLSGLYSDIYDRHISKFRSVRTDYNKFKEIADRAGKKLCPIVKKSLDAEILEPADAVEVQAIYDELAANWPGFKTWWSATNQISQEIDLRNHADIEKWWRESEEAMTPKCDEYPTADGKYVVVECSAPPG